MAKIIRQSTKVKEALDKAVSSLGAKSLEVGFLESARYEDGTPVAGVAVVHEFGSPVNGIPPRSFMRKTAEDKQGEWSNLIEQGAKAVINGTETPETMLEKVGLVAAGNIKTTITQITTPALSPATIKKKGSSKPLIEDGILLNSVTHRVK